MFVISKEGFTLRIGFYTIVQVLKNKYFFGRLSSLNSSISLVLMAIKFRVLIAVKSQSDSSLCLFLQHYIVAH